MSSSLTSFKQLLLANWPMTAIYCAIYWSYGMCVAFLGPTLFDLGCVIATPLSRMSWLFFSQLLFTLVGSMLAGYLVKRCVIIGWMGGLRNTWPPISIEHNEHKKASLFKSVFYFAENK